MFDRHQPVWRAGVDWGSDEWFSEYQTWVRTKAKCLHCGKRRMDLPGYYGLAPMERWITETDCGCKSNRN